MKDIFGKNIEVGDHVVYIIAAYEKHFEKAIVIESEEKFVKIEYLGISSNDSSWRKKEKGKKGRLTATEKKVIILNSTQSDEKNIYKNERKRFDKEIKQIQKELMATIKRETNLLEKNKSLMAEVDKIHDRFDILDL